MTKADKLGGRKTLKVEGILEELEKDRLKASIDIVELFGSFGIELTKKGSSYMGRCPFHDDSNPSLSVDREKGLYNCFGCGESGDAFTLVQKLRGLDFKGALDYFKHPSPRTSLPPRPPRAETVHTPVESPVESPASPSVQAPQPSPILESSNAEDALPPRTNLDDIAAYYRRSLDASLDAKNYLASRGLSLETARRYGLGYCDNTLSDTLPSSQKSELLTWGIFRDSGPEHLSRCITVPLLDAEGAVVGFYGRRLGDDDPASAQLPRHLYLKGKHRGLVNRQAAEVYADELILTESVIDALSLIELGLLNVIPCYGSGGFTEEHRAVLDSGRVKLVVIAFDADDAGRSGASKLASALIERGLEVKRIEPSNAKDWNEFLVAGGSSDAVRSLIAQAAVEGRASNEGGPTVTREGKFRIFSFPDVRYRVLVSSIGGSSLRANIRAQADDDTHLDTCDLYSARGRGSFAQAFARVSGLEAVRIERNLLTIVERIEAEREAELSRAPGADIPEPSEEELMQAREFLTDPDIIDRLVRDLDALGYVGERANKTLAYLAAVSRLLAKPLSVYIQAGSSSGKSFLLETVRRLLPPEAVLAVSSFSDQALNYMKGDDFTGKVMLLGEAIHNEIVEAQIRQMQSEGELSRLVVVKDPISGELGSRQVRHAVALCFMMSSTALYLNPENASRCLVLHTDESRSQTERILRLQRTKKTYEGYAEATGRVPQIVKTHQVAQRILRRLPVFNPLAPFLSFPVSRPTMRRTQDQFLTLLEAVALLRQYQKEEVMRANPFSGEKVAGIEVDLEDYRIASELFSEAVLAHTAVELPSGAKLLYDTLRAAAVKKARKEGLEPTEVSFIQRDIRELSELGSDSIKKYLRTLVDFEYLEITSGRKNGTRYSYRLRDSEEPRILEAPLPTIDELRTALQAGKTG